MLNVLDILSMLGMSKILEYYRILIYDLLLPNISNIIIRYHAIIPCMLKKDGYLPVCQRFQNIIEYYYMICRRKIAIINLFIRF